MADDEFARSVRTSDSPGAVAELRAQCPYPWVGVLRRKQRAGATIG